MTSADSSKVDQKFLANAMASFLQIGALMVLVFWCFNIVKPFIGIVVWAVIIAVAVYPLHVSLAARIGGREKTSAVIFALIGLTIILLPTWILGESTFGGLKTLGQDLRAGTLTVPPPSPDVADWPVIGEKTYEIWSGAAANLQATAMLYEEQLRALGHRVFNFATGSLVGVLQFVVSTIIAAALLLQARGGYSASRQIMTSLVGTANGDRFTDMSISTIRSVVKGVLGVAVIQALAAAVGLVVAGIPMAGIWAGAVLVVAIVQLPPILVLGPIAFWYFSVAEPVPATSFLVYSFVVSFLDGVLKPMLLGRGLETPMLVILIGAIGGAIMSGIVGLFIGAVVLALGYELLIAWMAPDAPGPAADPA
ncbi:MAG TPA: AI-2E family transporter [Woeseiaceae bacterium]|nr:AI-2E family transporter [Woeseiaceae bacterium]